MALTRWRPSATTILVVTVLALLPVLATAQYRWLGQISDNERGRLQRALVNGMSGVARDLDSEVTRAVAQLDVAGLVTGASAEGATAPQAVDAVFYVARPAGHDDMLSLARCDVRARRCSPADWPEEFFGLRRAIDAVVRSGPLHDIERLSRTVRTAHGSRPIIVLPVGEGSGYHDRRPGEAGQRPLHDHAAGPAGVALVLLNDRWLRTDLVPRIVERYFGPAADSDFQVAIVARSAPGDVVYADRRVAAGEIVAHPEGRQELFALRAGVSRDRWSRNEGEGDDWVMVARHRRGSLQAAVDDVRRRNLLISFGTLSLMGIAVGLIAVTTRRARRLAEQQIEFVAGVSHELRTPVSAIHLAAQNLADGTVTDAARVQRYGETIQTETQRLRDTVERVLQFAAISAGQPIGSRVGVDIGALVEEVAVSARAAQVGSEIEVTVGPDVPTVLGDPLALRACVQNLVANALKYGGRPARVAIAIAVDRGRQDPEVLLSFEDNGPGIATHERARVFEPFFRGRAALEQRVPGSGLGLHLVRRLVMAHGGRIDLQTAAGGGAAFLIHLPIGAPS